MNAIKDMGNVYSMLRGKKQDINTICIVEFQFGKNTTTFKCPWACKEMHKKLYQCSSLGSGITGNFYSLLETSLYFQMFTGKFVLLVYSESNVLLVLFTCDGPLTALAVGKTYSILPVVTPFLWELVLASPQGWASCRRTQSSSSLALDPRSMGSVPYFCCLSPT